MNTLYSNLKKMEDGPHVGNRGRRQGVVYTNQEYADMVYMYGLADGNAREAARLYRERFPARPVNRYPDRRTIQTAYENLGANGNFRGNIQNAGRHANVFDEHEDGVLNFFLEDPEASVRDAERNLGVSKTLVHRILKADGQHPYHFTKVQNLSKYIFKIS